MSYLRHTVIHKQLKIRPRLNFATEANILNSEKISKARLKLTSDGECAMSYSDFSLNSISWLYSLYAVLLSHLLLCRRKP